MRQSPRLQCFFSRRSNSADADETFKTIKAVCDSMGLAATSGTPKFMIGDLRREIREAIDNSLAVIVDTREFSWWVAFELYYALERTFCIPLIEEKLDPEKGEKVNWLLHNIDYLDFGAGLESELRDALEQVLASANNWTVSVYASLSRSLPDPPQQYTPPDLQSVDGRTPTTTSLFSHWLHPRGATRSEAVIGPPGGGKTSLLLKFCRTVAVKKSTIRRARDLCPLVMPVVATDIPADALATPEAITEFFRQSANRESPQRSLFDPFRQAGLVYVLIDGIDEFFVRRRDEVDPLLNALIGLRAAQIHVILTCRENLWVQQIRELAGFRTVRVLPLSEQQASQHLHDVVIPKSGNKRVPEWLLIPQILAFVQDLKKSRRLVVFETRTDLYEQWARHALNRASASLGVKVESLLRFHGEVALTLLRRRDKRMAEAETVPLRAAVFGEPIPTIPEITHSGILRVSDFDVSFAHESIYEFFVARAVRDDFLRAMDPAASPQELSTLGLALVELDYPQSAVYGFLKDLLGNRSNEQVRAAITGLAGEGQLWRLLRNFIEFVGMTHEGPCDESLVTTLLEIAENPSPVARVRYNALRAIERIHPAAPQPYFKHVSDWGPLDYAQLNERARQPETDWPWVMRGHGRAAPVPGRHWAWEPKAPQIHPPPSLNEVVSQRLGRLLVSLLEDGRAPDQSKTGIMINASHAWIRWFHSRDLKLLDHLRKLPEAALGPEVSENLRRFVGGDGRPINAGRPVPKPVRPRARASAAGEVW